MSNAYILAFVFFTTFGLASLLQMLKSLAGGGAQRIALAPVALMMAVVLATTISKFLTQLLPG